jgi:hypothetical protein
MTFEAFRNTLTHPTPPRELSPPLTALWHDARGEWDAAHRVAQELDDSTGAGIHAYLHRREGDLDNAAYWYRRAGRPVANDALDAEWERLARAHSEE